MAGEGKVMLQRIGIAEMRGGDSGRKDQKVEKSPPWLS